MDDVAGCRVIFPDITTLYEFRERLHKARFKHKRRNDIDKYDYIKYPKNTGYRGIHDIYEYDVNSTAGDGSRGLFVEIQYRTFVQHAWATAVELIGHVTASQPKFQQGDKRYEAAMAYASEILARAHENRRSTFNDLEDDEILKRFMELDAELALMNLLRNLNAADAQITSNKNIILIFSDTSDLETISFSSATDALRALFEMEGKNPGKDIVLVRADSTEEARTAFRNYFSDARDFIDLMDSGCEKLAGRHRVLHIDKSTDEGPNERHVHDPDYL